ncbi:hypothetical protein HY095_05275 [Candidatus Micrarchaeota archaeon]|nr:hypothetical protein [Candidatus Micrarchaeota archaeon]
MKEEIAYLIGALRDGNFSEVSSEGIYRIRFYQKSRLWLEFLEKIIEDNFGKKAGFYLDARHEVWCLSITSKEIYRELTQISEYTGDQATWKMPSWIVCGLPRLKKAYVRGFFDAEGSVNSLEKCSKPAEKDIGIYLAQANKAVLEEIRQVLLDFGIRCGRVCGPYVKKGASTEMYALIVHGSAQVLNSYNCFDSSHPEKVLRFNLLKSAKKGDKDSSVASPRSVWPSEGKVL